MDVVTPGGHSRPTHAHPTATAAREGQWLWLAAGLALGFAIPFLLLFVCGYYWAGFSTLIEEYRGRLRWQRERKLAEAGS